MPLTQYPEYTPLRAVYRSPMGFPARTGGELILSIVTVSSEDAMGTPDVDQNVYNSDVAKWRTDNDRWKAYRASNGVPPFIVMAYIVVGWSWASYSPPYYSTSDDTPRHVYLADEHDGNNTMAGDYLTDTVSNVTDDYWEWGVYGAAGAYGIYMPEYGFRKQPSVFSSVKLMLEDSDNMTNYVDMATALSNLTDIFDTGGTSYTTTTYTGSGGANDQGRWMEWVCDYIGA